MFRVTAFGKLARQIKMKIAAKYSNMGANGKAIGLK